MLTQSIGISQKSFTPTCWEIIKASKQAANECRINSIENPHLLASLAKSETPQGKALRTTGITYGEVLSYCSFHNKNFRTLSFNEHNPVSNFTSSGVNLLNQALEIADIREKSEVGVQELFEALSGLHIRTDKEPRSSEIIREILEEHNLSLPALINLVKSFEKEL